MTHQFNKSLKLNLLNIFIFSLIFLCSRLFLIYFFFEEGADWEKYLNVAKNILNGCGVSQSYMNLKLVNYHLDLIMVLVIHFMFLFFWYFKRCY